MTTVNRGESTEIRRAPRPRSDEGRPGRVRRAAPDVVGVLAVVAAAVVVLVPALAHGASLGPFDLLSRYGVTARSGVAVHNSQTIDQIAEMIPWTVLSWTQVHAGHLPLWNSENTLGLPLAFNWQSGVFSLPNLLGYLAPLRLAYTVQVLTTLVLGGTGVYVLARVLRLHVVACVMAAVVYELSGDFMGFLGWPIATVMAWAGWLFVAVVLVARGRHRLRAVALLAVVEAWAVYAGQPDALVVVGLGLGIFVVVLLVAGVRRGGTWGALRRPLGDLVAASAVGAALAAPLLLPGFQLARASVFLHAPRTNSALSPYSLVNFLFQGFNGLPAARSQWFAAGSSAYVGVIGLVLAVAGAALRRRRPEVLGLTLVGVVMAALAFVPALADAVNELPFRARWHLGLVVVTLAVAVLAGVGTDALIRAPRAWMTRVWLASGFGVAALVEASLWLVGRGHLAPAAARVRNQSFVWPAVETVVGLAVTAALARAARGRERAPGASAGVGLGHGAALVLLACQSAFLIGVGTSVFPSSPVFLPTTPALQALQARVGSSLVGFGAHSCQLPPTLGVLPEANAAYGVHELSAYDPITPLAYFHTLRVPQTLPVSAFCPVVTSVAEARRYGVAFILVPDGARGPAGTVPDGVVGDEALYRVPGAAPATLTPARSSGALPGPDAPGRAVAVGHPGPSTWRIVTDAARPQVLRLRLTDVPGWHATVDGRPVPLQRFAGVMLETRVPAGRHTVELTYWPATFSAGIALGGVGAAALVVAAALRWRARRRHGTPRGGGPRPAPAAP